ncbi:hypothetical protein LPB19_13435 [Marinobacter salinisoli]|uniref:Tetratricopeptide repeat protein n=1 Tax=Marinobacter salinisoli TaxID=2769486 RepID=A0ABX7MPH3_9GAMM|nr:hypothetical protein [Marinobacter salinisoli]QSP94183.1 hypothetical protein LPB19_13435 [Marinobacter salinisoli]
MMGPRDTKEATAAARQFYAWIEYQDHSEVPDFMNDPRLEVGLARMLPGVILHALLSLFGVLFQKARLWSLLGLVARMRIRTDWLSPEPRQCGYNAAYTRLGLAELKRGNTAAAIICLEESAKVWPCAHSASFGLRTELARELEKVAQANAAVKAYWQVAQEFKA